jgi:hypothetical protein
LCETYNSVATLRLFLFSTKKDDAFTSTGYNNWKHALTKFAVHEKSQCHREAVLKLSHVTERTSVVAMLSTAHQQERRLAKTAS